jgi:NAD(P)-dependent dehydrogenase (short-subunit alcohol dehydrogenase family)
VIDLSGQTAVVTGAGNGLGRAYARWLAAHGCAVVVNNRASVGCASSAGAVVDEIRAEGGRAIAHEGPVEIEASATDMVALAHSTFGSCDILVCNAGIQHWRDFAEVTIAEMRRLIDINLWGTIFAMKAAWPAMVARDYGRIVLTGSSAGLWGQMQSADYSASKAAMVGLARAASLDAPAEADIRINVIAPAAYTPMSSGSIGAEWAEYCSTDKVAPVVGWLSSRLCQSSGGLYHAGAGRVRRVQVLEGPMVELSDGPIEKVMAELEALPEPLSSFGSGALLMHEMAASIAAAAARGGQP